MRNFWSTDDPRLMYSFNAGAEWNGFDLNVIFQGVGKRTIVRDGNLADTCQRCFSGPEQSI